MKTYTLHLSEAHLQILSAALGEQPYRVSAPVIDEINMQLRRQQAQEQARAAPKGGVLPAVNDVNAPPTAAPDPAPPQHSPQPNGSIGPVAAH